MNSYPVRSIQQPDISASTISAERQPYADPTTRVAQSNIQQQPSSAAFPLQGRVTVEEKGFFAKIWDTICRFFGCCNSDPRPVEDINRVQIDPARVVRQEVLSPTASQIKQLDNFVQSIAAIDQQRGSDDAYNAVVGKWKALSPENKDIFLNLFRELNQIYGLPAVSTEEIDTVNFWKHRVEGNLIAKDIVRVFESRATLETIRKSLPQMTDQEIGNFFFPRMPGSSLLERLHPLVAESFLRNLAIRLNGELVENYIASIGIGNDRYSFAALKEMCGSVCTSMVEHPSLCQAEFFEDAESIAKATHKLFDGAKLPTNIPLHWGMNVNALPIIVDPVTRELYLDQNGVPPAIIGLAAYAQQIIDRWEALNIALQKVDTRNLQAQLALQAELEALRPLREYAFELNDAIMKSDAMKDAIKELPDGVKRHMVQLLKTMEENKVSTDPKGEFIRSNSTTDILGNKLKDHNRNKLQTSAWAIISALLAVGKNNFATFRIQRPGVRLVMAPQTAGFAPPVPGDLTRMQEGAPAPAGGEGEVRRGITQYYNPAPRGEQPRQ